MQRKVFSAEFKAKVVMETLAGRKMVNEIAGVHEVHPNQVTTWKREAQEGLKALFERKRGRLDTKKQELVGDFKNGGQEWCPKGNPEPVRVYDFVDKVLGKVNPYGVYDPTTNVGWVSVGVDHDTAELAVETLRRWWEKMGHACYPTATELLVTADGGGSNGARVRLWKVALQRLADQTGLHLSVCHFPPGTSKWNKIEHRMFSHISLNWRGKPLFSHEVVVNLIAGTTPRTGLRIEAELDTNTYPTGIQVTDAELDKIKIQRADFHGEWNYTILPTT